MIQIEYLPIVLTGIGIMVSMLYYAGVLRNQNTQRNTSLYLDFFNKIYSEPLKSQFYEVMCWSFDSFDDFESKYAKLPNRDNWYNQEREEPIQALVDVLFHFEMMGTLWSTNTIDIPMISRMSDFIISFWQKYEALIYEWRRRGNLYYAWVEFEELYLRILEYQREHSPVSDMIATFESRRKALGLPTYSNR